MSYKYACFSRKDYQICSKLSGQMVVLERLQKLVLEVEGWVCE